MRRTLLIALPIAVLLLSGCGDDDTTSAPRPTVVVTTSILGDVVGELVGDHVDVVTVMPAGVDPHSFQASAQQVAAIREAEALVVNGGGFEDGLDDVIEAAERDGVPTFAAISAIDTIDLADHEDDGDHDDDDDHGDEHGHEGVDPHFFTDPVRVADAAEAISEFLVDNGIEADASAYVGELGDLDAEIRTILDPIPSGRRVLVTDHEVFGYFADRYGFEVVGTVIPSGTTTDAVSAAALAELVSTVRHTGVPAVFSDASSSDLVATLADEVGDVEVVELYAESLGEPGSEGATYLDMVRTNARRIVAALG